MAVDIREGKMKKKKEAKKRRRNGGGIWQLNRLVNMKIRREEEEVYPRCGAWEEDSLEEWVEKQTQAEEEQGKKLNLY